MTEDEFRREIERRDEVIDGDKVAEDHLRKALKEATTIIMQMRALDEAWVGLNNAMAQFLERQRSK